jgi:hypothetical protein
MKSHLSRALQVVILIASCSAFSVGIAAAATTIGTDITSAGNLSVSGNVSASSTIFIGNADSDFTPALQGWTFAVNSINRIQGTDGHANLEATIQSIDGVEAIWGVSYVTGNDEEADGVTADANINGGDSTAIASQPRASTDGGTNETLYGVQTTISASNSAVATIAAGVDITSPFVFTGGSILNNYGLLVGDQTAGTNNYAIKTGLGKVSFGDKVGISTTSPVANFQVANGSNATTTMELGSSGQNKGSCLKLYRTDGSAIYAYVAAGATTFTLTTTACASVSNF